MRPKTILAFALSLAAAAAVLAQASGEAKAKSRTRMNAGKAPMFLPAGELKWVDLDAKAAPGVKIADLWGNHAKGAYGALIKFPAGFTTPLHTHTNAARLVIVSGTFIQAPEGKPEVRLGPGSYLMQPGASYRHTTSCDKASECVFLAQMNGKFDFKPVAEANAPAKK